MQGTPYPCLLGGRLHKIYRDDVQNAMREFDAKRGNEPVTGRKYFLWFEGKRYPPKRILSSVTGVPANKFSGGDPTNQALRDLGFVVATPKGQRELKRRQHGSEPPSAKTLVRKLFRKKWSPLVRNFRGTSSGKYPGVYVLAFSSDRKLSGKRIHEGDIFYVGMSNANLSIRLNQFLSGQHSAAIRFRKKWGRYREIVKKRHFYVATLTIPCETEKGFRTERDLRNLGRISELEYATLAHVKSKTGFEPLLNKK
jgi:hypothetical protein